MPSIKPKLARGYNWIADLSQDKSETLITALRNSRDRVIQESTLYIGLSRHFLHMRSSVRHHQISGLTGLQWTLASGQSKEGLLKNLTTYAGTAGVREIQFGRAAPSGRQAGFGDWDGGSRIGRKLAWNVGYIRSDADRVDASAGGGSEGPEGRQSHLLPCTARITAQVAAASAASPARVDTAAAASLPHSFTADICTVTNTETCSLLTADVRRIDLGSQASILHTVVTGAAFRPRVPPGTHPLSTCELGTYISLGLAPLFLNPTRAAAAALLVYSCLLLGAQGRRRPRPPPWTIQELLCPAAHMSAPGAAPRRPARRRCTWVWTRARAAQKSGDGGKGQQRRWRVLGRRRWTWSAAPRERATFALVANAGTASKGVCAGSARAAATASERCGARSAGAPRSAATASERRGARSAGAPRSAATASERRGARSAGAPRSAATAKKRCRARSAGAPRSAATAEKRGDAKSAGALASAATGKKRGDAKSAGAPPSAATGSEGVSARSAGALASAFTASE
jgi:hypothetical protein